MTKMAENKTYLCIDLKSFFASVECVERGLDHFAQILLWRMPHLLKKPFALQYLRR